MIARRCRYLVPLVLLAGCAGNTMRVAEDDPADSPPVSLSAQPDDSTAPVPAPAPPADTTSVGQPAPAAAPASQGYAPYGDTGALSIRRLGQWTRTGISESRRLVIRDANAWAAFWSELGVGERPEIDFTRDLIVAVAAGQRPSGGFEIAINRITQSAGELGIEVVETEPGPNCMTSGSLTQPVDVVAVQAVSARSWSFSERKEVRGCR